MSDELDRLQAGLSDRKAELAALESSKVEARDIGLSIAVQNQIVVVLEVISHLQDQIMAHLWNQLPVTVREAMQMSETQQQLVEAALPSIQLRH